MNNDYLRKLSADLHASMTSLIMLASESFRVSFISMPGVGILILRIIFSATAGWGRGARAARVGVGDDDGVGDVLPCTPMCWHDRALVDFFAGIQPDLGG